MKKFAILALALSSMLTFTACGSNDAKTESTTNVETSTEATTEETTETSEEEATEETTEEAAAEVTVEEAGENVKVGKVADAEGGVTTATVTYEGETPVSIAFDYIQADGSSKYEAAAKGEYGMNWHEQADFLAAFIKENNFDVTKVTLSDEEGHTDAVTGVSIKVPEMIKAAEAVLAQ